MSRYLLGDKFWLVNLSKTLVCLSLSALGHLWSVCACDLERQCPAECDPEGHGPSCVVCCLHRALTFTSEKIPEISFMTKKLVRSPETKRQCSDPCPLFYAPNIWRGWFIHQRYILTGNSSYGSGRTGDLSDNKCIFSTFGSIHTVTASRGRQLCFVKRKYHSSSMKCQCSRVFVTKL